MLPLETIVVNLAGPDNRWLRFEGVVVFTGSAAKENSASLPKYIMDDLVGFLRRTTLSQLDTAAGLEFLRDDMEELVRLRSNGRANTVLIKTLVVE